MNADRIRSLFLEYFAARGHTVVPASNLVPADDPTLLFVNAGMVQFKRTFLGQEVRPYVRATSCQTCVRAGGKHNDLEQVGTTRRHGTFFEMLGNFSFGDYFKREAIAFAWEFVTSPQWLGLHPDQLRVSVHHTDDEARALWGEIAGLPEDRIYGLGDKDNFWQMGDTGPCGPCTEIFVDLAWTPGMPPARADRAEFEALCDAERFVEIWNLVFMQFDRSADGTLTSLPKPSVDTGAGLDRLTAVLDGHGDIFHTSMLRPLIQQVELLVHAPYPGGPVGTGVSYRALADHARTVTFLLADGVYPGNEGRGFVLRRILRRAVRHAWLLGRREPTLAPMVATVVEVMGGAYPVLSARAEEITRMVRREEESFLSTIEAGQARLEELRATGATAISGEDAFRLFDTFGYPLDLVQVIADEWGMTVDAEGFERAMSGQRERSRSARAGSVSSDAGTSSRASLTIVHEGASQRFVGYELIDLETDVLAHQVVDGRAELVLRDNPFYAQGGGQVSDTGIVNGNGWSMIVESVAKDPSSGHRVSGPVVGEFSPGTVRAAVDATRRRDIERNHSATHLVHLELRRALGGHVRQQGSLVEPGRLRFDFSHHGPIEPAQLADIESAVNELVLANAPSDIREMPLAEALASGAMAFFADKYGDTVRVVRIGESVELCGGTHVRSSGEVGQFRFTSQGGVAAGVRRIEASTGRSAYAMVREVEQRLAALADAVRTQPEHLERRVAALLAERDRLESRLAEALRSGASSTEAQVIDLGGVTLHVAPTVAEDRAALGEIADAFRARSRERAILVLHNPTAPAALSVAVTDDLAKAGKDANTLVKLVTARFGGRGGGRPTFASGSLSTGSVAELAASELRDVIRDWVTG